MKWSRVIRAGALWAVVYGVLGAVAMALFLGREFMLELERLGRPMELAPESLLPLGVFGLLFTLGWGMVSMWLYFAIRPRFGPGPRTAVLAGVVVWLLSIVAPVTHLLAFGLSSWRFAAFDVPAELVLISAATVLAAWRYRD